ncbi:MAG: hypothetical protein C0432_02270 [Candidatus Puniceispirillum sp.]|nr:hypothetical protein [Candidatus Pelagibacter sp.]MBA4283101.1 hypothetical protein [Candidatus Puniceispirillum sp.]
MKIKSIRIILKKFLFVTFTISATLNTYGTENVIKYLEKSKINIGDLSEEGIIIISKHIESLPKIDIKQGSALQAISSYLKKCIKNKPKSSIEDLVKNSIGQRERIQCVMLGFPVKSQNMDEVYNHQAGLGDFLSLLTLHYIACEIEKVYAPGVTFKIISDYVALKEIVDPESATVYQTGIQTLANLFPDTIIYDLSFHDIDCFTIFQESTAYNKRYSEAGKGNSIKIHEALLKSKQFSDYITNEFKNIPHLRFSVHSYKNGESNKLTLPFYSNKLGTPCHHVCLVNYHYNSAFVKYKKVSAESTIELKTLDITNLNSMHISLPYFQDMKP